MRFSWFQPCAGNAAVCAPRILAEGEITDATPQAFLAFVRRERVTYPVTVCFASPGGSLAGGLALGRAIRSLGFDTCLEDEYAEETSSTSGPRTIARNALCASACTFAFIGGVKRDLGNQARFGVHQFFGARGQIGDGPTQVTVVALAAYVEEMGVDRGLLDLASLVPSDRIRFLEMPLLVDLGVTNTREQPAQWQLAATEAGVPFAMVRQAHSDKASSIAVVVMGRTSDALMYVAYYRDQRSRARSEVIRLLESASLEIRAGNVVVGRVAQPKWQSGQKGEIVTSLRLPPAAVAHLLQAKTLRVSVGLARAYYDIDPTIDLSTRGMSKSLRAALR